MKQDFVLRSSRHLAAASVFDSCAGPVSFRLWQKFPDIVSVVDEFVIEVGWVSLFHIPPVWEKLPSPLFLICFFWVVMLLSGWACLLRMWLLHSFAFIPLIYWRASWLGNCCWLRILACLAYLLLVLSWSWRFIWRAMLRATSRMSRAEKICRALTDCQSRCRGWFDQPFAQEKNRRPLWIPVFLFEIHTFWFDGAENSFARGANFFVRWNKGADKGMEKRENCAWAALSLWFREPEK